MSKISGVYLVRNTITNDCYVGSSVDIERRWSNHKSPSRWKNCPNSLLYKAFQKYGLNNFSFEILEECDKSQLSIREQYCIKKLKPTYNCNRAFRTEEELVKQHREVSKKWHKTHQEQYLEYQRQYQRQWRAKKKAEKLS